MNDNNFRIETLGSRWGLPSYDPNSTPSTPSSSRREVPSLDQVLLPKSESDLLADRNVSKIDRSSPSLKIIGSISTQTFNPQPTVESPTFGYQLYAASTVTSQGSNILLSKKLSSSGGLPVDWETKAGGTFWDYHSTMKEGRNEEYHQFTLKPPFSYSDPDKKDIFIRENQKQFPAIVDSNKFISLEDDLKTLGFGYDAKNEIFRVPSLKTLIINWDVHRQTLRPEMPPLCIILCDGTEDDLEFASMVSKGLIPVSINTQYEHDITVHIMGWFVLLTNLETKEDVAHYLTAKTLNSKILSRYLEALNGKIGKALTDLAYEQYFERQDGVKRDLMEIEKLNFYHFCHTFIGFLADAGSAHEDSTKYVSFTNLLFQNMQFVRFGSSWEKYFVERYGDASKIFLNIFCSEVVKLILVSSKL